MIVDASVAFKWLVPEPDSALAVDWLGRDLRFAAPSLIFAEVGNAITKRIRRGQLLAPGTQAQFERFPSLLTLLDDAPFMARAFDLAVTLRHSFYACVYLAAAEAMGDRLLTADGVFAGKLADHPLREQIVVLS